MLPAARRAGELTDELLQSGVWTDDMLERAGIPITDVPFVTVGGGIGSFVTADYLRIAGVADGPDRGAVQHRLPVADV